MSARSLRPRGVATSGCSMSRSTSSIAEQFWKRRPRPRCLKIVGWVRVDVLREHGKPVEPPNGGDRPRDRPRRQPFVHHAVDKMFEIAAVQALNRFFERLRQILQAVGDRGCSSQECDRPGAVRRAGASDTHRRDRGRLTLSKPESSIRPFVALRFLHTRCPIVRNISNSQPKPSIPRRSASTRPLRPTSSS